MRQYLLKIKIHNVTTHKKKGQINGKYLEYISAKKMKFKIFSNSLF